MNIEIKIALISAVVALITSMISAYFSYANSKNQSKSKKQDAYSSFLKDKICRLEKELQKIQSEETLEKEELGISIINSFEKRGKILIHNSHFLPEQKLNPILKQKELINKSIAIYRAKNKFGENAIKKDVGELMPSNEILKEAISFNDKAENLIRSELKLTVNKLEESFK